MGPCSQDPVHRGVGQPHPTSPCFQRQDSVTFFHLDSETFPATWFPRVQFRHCLPFEPSMLTARAPPRMPPTAVPPLPPVGLPLNAPAPSNYYENGRMYGGFRKGKYMFPNDEVIWGRFGVALWEEWANMGFCTGRDGSHGYLSQILFGRKTRSSPFDSLYTELR
jgi:hypothetical protein